MTAVIYARYSSDNQREESIEGQIRECTAYAKKNGITIVKHYIDRAISAKTDNRPQFQQMIKDSDKKLFDIVLVWKLDRFARNRYDSARYKTQLKKNGVKLMSATEIISEGPEGIILESVLEGYAEYYSADLAEKVVRGQTENILKGRCNGGRGTFGYTLDSERKFHIDPLASPFVLESFTKYRDGLTMKEIRDWLNENGIEVNSLAKAAVEELVENTQGDVAEMMKLRLAMSKTSVKKYEAMERSVCPDGRVHGLLQFYGANRTGRWAGRLVQIHNLPQNHMEDLELARSLVKEGRYDLVELLYDSIPDVLSELIRTAFVAKPGCRFIVSDFSAIEARVMGYLAGEGWVMEEFRGAGKIYEQTASKMFHIPIEEITKGSPYRARGKVASLACQYGGAEGALISMGALNFVEEEELKGLVQSWRTANPHIVNYWYEIDGAVKAAVKERKMTKVGMVTVYYQSGMLKIALPSGRVLSYVRPRMTVNRFGSESVSYEGIGTNRKWTRIESYGAKFCENIVQATARDVLAEAMLRLEKKGFDIVCHIHDEVVLEVPEGASSVEEVNGIMAVCPDWCEGLPLKAAGFESPFYKKD